jgi:hypothetical protein
MFIYSLLLIFYSLFMLPQKGYHFQLKNVSFPLFVSFLASDIHFAHFYFQIACFMFLCILISFFPLLFHQIPFVVPAVLL